MVLEHYTSNAIPVLGEHHSDHKPDRRFVIANFQWDQRTEQTYTLTLNPFLSVELSRDFAIKPMSVSLYDGGAEESAQALEDIAGKEFAKNMTQAPLLGKFIMTVALSNDERFYIAALQNGDPSTPTHLREGCLAFIDEHTARPDSTAAA